MSQFLGPGRLPPNVRRDGEQLKLALQTGHLSRCPLICAPATQTMDSVTVTAKVFLTDLFPAEMI